MPAQHTTTPKRTCDVPGCTREAVAVVLNKHVCAPCYLKAEDEDVRLYRKSLTVVRGGLPG